MSSKQMIIATIIAEKEKERQRNCKHDMVSFPVFDHDHDEIYYFGICRSCGYKEE